MRSPLGQCLRELPGPLLLTGHTGFKGTWMTFLLERLGVPVVGYSLPPEINSLFDRAERTGAIPEIFGDIRSYETLEKFIDQEKPSTIFHMAAQPLVLKSYETPRETFDVNIMGTVNLLDIAFKKDFVKAIIVVTTDKVYQNDNSGRAFVETDSLEGKDPYSASKVGTEAVVTAWQQIARVSGGPKVVSVRAGNVIGGGDFAADRIIPDLIRGIMSSSSIRIRNPESTRPWQHVMDPLAGYLMCLDLILAGHNIEKVNFGPTGNPMTVHQLIKLASNVFPSILRLIEVDAENKIHLEANSLSLDSSLSKEKLGWISRWESDQAIQKTFAWWSDYFEGRNTPYELCLLDIDTYLKGESIP
jgi:CDP-glucose 4,6-dehydratase